MNQIKTLQEFYTLMFGTKEVRSQITDLYLKDEPISAQLTNPLRESLETLTALNRQSDGTYQVELTEGKTISLDLTYEIEELKKDIFFLENDEGEFYAYLENIHPNFLNQLNECEAHLQGMHFNNFITDRDGTVSNYCGRYVSSIQSIYNAVFLTRFANNCTENSVILTSAPLDNIGLANISVSPKNVFVYAGSKGREYFDKKENRKTFPIEKEKQAKLDELNTELKKLVKQSQYEMFSLIGSGLQFKFGQTTIARQDITKSIPEQESTAFLNLVTELTQKIDPNNKFFRIEDTGKDIEIILTVESSDDGDGSKDFDKGNGIDFLDDDLNLKISEGPCLVCGDTNSDVPMVHAAMKKCENTYSVFVTVDAALKEKVTTACPNSFIVSTPDILVAALNNLGLRKN